MHEKYGAHGTRTNEEKRHDASWGRSQAHRGLRADAEAQERRRHASPARLTPVSEHADRMTWLRCCLRKKDPPRSQRRSHAQRPNVTIDACITTRGRLALRAGGGWAPLRFYEYWHVRFLPTHAPLDTRHRPQSSLEERQRWGEQQDVTRRSNGYAAAEGVDPNDWFHRRQAPAPPPLVNEAVTRQLGIILRLRGERVCSLPPHVIRYWGRQDFREILFEIR